MKRALIMILLATHCAEGSQTRPVRAESDLQGLRTIVALFEVVNGRLPTAEEGLQALVTNPDPVNLSKWRPLLEEVPVDPWGRPYQYVPRSSARQDFGIFSFGADGISRSNGDDPDDLSTWKANDWYDRDPTNRIVVASLGTALILALLGYLVWRRRVAVKSA